MKLVFDMEIVFPEDFFCTHQRCDAGRISFPLHSHDFFEFFWIDQGEAVHFLNSREYHLPERTLHLIRPGDTHYLKASGTFGQLAFFNINVRSNLFMTLFHLIGGGRLSPDDMGTSFLLSEKAFQEFSLRAERLLKLQDHYDLYAARVEGTSLIFEIMATFLRHFSPDVNLEPAWLKELLQKMRLPDKFRKRLRPHARRQRGPRVFTVKHGKLFQFNHLFEDYFIIFRDGLQRRRFWEQTCG